MSLRFPMLSRSSPSPDGDRQRRDSLPLIGPGCRGRAGRLVHDLHHRSARPSRASCDPPATRERPGFVDRGRARTSVHTRRMADLKSSRARGAVPDAPRQTWWDRAWSPFWALPAAIVGVSIIVGAALPELDRRIEHSVPYLFTGGPAAARDLLGTIAGAMISVTGLVFSITIVTLQLASSQFTPRILRGFLANRITQVTLGIFSASFVYSLTVLRSVRDGPTPAEGFVPQTAVTLAFALVLAAVGVFFAFINHITSSIQISNVISRIGDQARALIERTYPQPGASLSPAGPTWSPGPGRAHRELRLAQRHGVITDLDFPRLVSTAREHDVVLVLDEPIGRFVAAGQPVGSIWGPVADTDEVTDALGRAVSLGPQRTNLQDVAFSVRQLVDIAERALSPGINDPTTAVQVIDELHGILRGLVQRPSISPYVSDEDGQVRVVHRPPTFPDLLRLSTQEILHYGKDTIQVPHALLRMLDDLAVATRSEYSNAITAARQSVLDSSAHLPETGSS